MNYEDYLEYLPAPQDAKPFNKRMRDITDWNYESGETGEYKGMYLRFVWGCDRREFNCGENLCRYPDPNNQYVGLPMWVLEGWQSPDVLDRQQWQDNEDTLGPFPTGGHWDYIETYRTADYEFRPLGEAALQKAREWRIWKDKRRPVMIEDLLAKMQRHRQLKDKRWKEFRDKRLGQMMDDIIALEKKGANPVSTSGSGVVHPEFTPDGYRRTESGILIKGA
jgi:hypothetical protein